MKRTNHIGSLKDKLKACVRPLLGALLVFNIPSVGGALGVMGIGATLLATTSCSEESDEQPEFPNWEATNTQYWNTLYADASQRIAGGDTSWKIFKKWSLVDTLHTDNTQYIVVHVLNEGTGSGCPLFTDSVRVHYRGHLLPSTSYPDGYEFGTSYTTGGTAESSAPAQFLVSRLTDGFATAVQHMHIGDEWQVYVPSDLGYGDKGSGTTIPGHSVLVFDITLDSYYHAGADVPDFKAKRWTFQ